jgi:hypothetical protein
MRLFPEFQKGDIHLSRTQMFDVPRKSHDVRIHLSDVIFDRTKLLGLFSADELDVFFASAFYDRLGRKLVDEDSKDEFPRFIPGDMAPRIVLGVVRHPDRWEAETSFDSEASDVYFTTPPTNLITTVEYLFATDADPLPQEMILVSRNMVDYTQFLPMVDMLDSVIVTPENLILFFHELSLFPLGEHNNYDQWRSFPEQWEPETMDLIMAGKLHSDLVSEGLAQDALAWSAALSLTKDRSRFYGYKEMLSAAKRGQRPHDYVKMTTRGLTNFESLFNAWSNDIDESLWEALIAGEEEARRNAR